MLRSGVEGSRYRESDETVSDEIDGRNVVATLNRDDRCQWSTRPRSTTHAMAADMPPTRVCNDNSSLKDPKYARPMIYALPTSQSADMGDMTTPNVTADLAILKLGS